MKKIAWLLLVIFLLNPSLIPEEDRDSEWKFQLRKYARIYGLIKDIYPGDIDEEKLIFASINGLLRSLDPHSYFMDPVAMRSMNEEQSGNYYGIGTRITKYEDRLTVVAPMAGGPAQKLGILAGDVIAEIDGKETKTMSMDDAMKILRGAKGTYVNIKIRRGDNPRLLPFRIKRAEIPLDSISYSVTHPDVPEVGYISIRTFGGTTTREFRERLDRLINEKKIKALIVDLRWNVGGALFSAIDISDLFLEKGKVIVSIKGRRVDQSYRAQRDDQYEKIPLVIMVNRVSASASEILAAAVQDHKRGTIVGTRSWGKGLVQTVYKLAMNSSMALTTAKYYTPKNKCLQRDFTKLDEYFSAVARDDYDTNQEIVGGVTPDHFIEGRLNPELVVDFISRGIFFQFARDLIKKDESMDRSFRVNKKTIKAFKKFLKDREVRYDKKVFAKNLEFIKDNIEREVLSGKFSISEGIKVYLRGDPVTQKAVEILQKEMKTPMEE